MKTEDFQVSWYPGVVQYVHKIYQTAADIPKKVKKHAARASVFLKVTNPPMKTLDFQVFWYLGVVQDCVHTRDLLCAHKRSLVRTHEISCAIPVLKSPSSDNMSHIFLAAI